jgi:fibronectin-binding autotransporter adhesin
MGVSAAIMIAGLYVGAALTSNGQDLRYWDIDGPVPGAGGPTPSGTWDATATNWSPAEAGDVETEAWLSGAAAGQGNVAVFSAGSDAVGSFTVTVAGTNNAAGMTVKAGTVNLAGTGAVALGAGAATVMPGATLSVNSVLRVTQSTGGLLVLDGATLQSTTGNAGSLWTATGDGILLTVNGGTIDYSANAVVIYQGKILGEGGTTDNGGAQTLTKTGSSELRVQTASTENYTFQKLVVKGGLYRLGSSTSGTPPVQLTQETGFGALPVAPLADAITLDGGGIGASFALQTDPFRGITLGPSGGLLYATAAALTVSGPIAGPGVLRVVGTNGLTLLSETSTRTGGTVIGSEFAATGGVTTATAGVLTIFGDGALGAVPATPEPANIRLGTATAAGTLTILNNDTVIDSNRGIEVGAGGGTLSSSRRIEYGGVLSGSGAFTKTSTGTLVLSGINTLTGNVTSFGGGVLEIAADENLGAVPASTRSNAITLAGATTSGRLRATESFTMAPTRGITVNVGGTTTPLGGTIEVSEEKTLTIGGPISGTGRFTKAGTGTLVLSGTNTYEGTTTVSGGTLVVNGSIASTGNVNLVGGTTLGGSGSLGGSLTVGSFTTLSPGSSPGTLSVGGNVTLGPGGNYNWQIFDATGAAGSIGGWDLLSVGGVLDITATSENPFAINLWSLSSTGPDVNGDALNFNATQGYTWTIASATGGITNFVADKFEINVSADNGAGGFANPLSGGTFSLSQAGNNLNLVFTADGPAAITIDVPSGTQTQAEAGYPTITTAGSVTKTGEGTVVFDAANGYSGPTTVSAGTLQLANADGLAATPVTVDTGATLAVASGTTMKAPSVIVDGGTLSAATLAINDSTGIASLAINAGTLAGSPAVSIGPGGQMSLVQDARVTVAVGGLAVAETSGGGRLDLGAGQVSVTAGGISAADLRADIIAGRNGGAWNGTTGILSSAAAASGGTRGVGYVVATDGSARVSYAAAGDVDLSGQVNVFDLVSVNSAGKYGSGQSAVWNQGDFNYDGVTNVFDLVAVNTAAVYGQGNYFPATPSVGGGLVAVPEPSMWCVVATSVVCAAGLRLRAASSAGRRCLK